VAYLVSQTVDVWLFARLRRWTGPGKLWLRVLTGSAAAQTLDTALFISLAFYGQFPLGPLLLGQLAVKYAIAAADAPLVYALVFGVRRWIAEEGAPARVD
jgi:uncharacterized integral membrane protein (TIGR00697 family)